MKRLLILVGALLAAGLLTVGATSSFGSSGHVVKKPTTISIQSWLQVTPATTGLAATVKACFRLSGAFKDKGGGPSWTDDTYATVPVNHADLAGKCDDWTPVGGAVFVPPATGTIYTLYAVHTITGQKGQIFITFAGTYDLGPGTLTGSGTWVITGGTGAYDGVRGEGMWTADAATLFDAGYIQHTETGTMTH